MIKKEDISMLVDICYSYYKYNKTQSEIAERLNISRAKVSNLLSEAHNQGIVSININDPLKKKQILEERLATKYNLREAVVLPLPLSSTINIKKQLGKITSVLLKKILRDGDTIAVSGGTTIYEVVNSLDKLNLSNIIIVPMFGVFLAVSHIGEDLYSYDIVRTFAEKVGGEVVNISAPGKVNDKQMRELFVSHDIIKKGLNIAKNCSVALVGIGSVTPNATVFTTNVFTEKDYQELIQENAVGDIGLQYFDKNGNGCNKFNSRVVGMSLEDIKRVPLVIGVGGGKEKIKAIESCLEGGYLHILVTDQNTAKTILDGVEDKDYERT